ncbi:MAG: hypothetical protein WAL05_22555 [Candidatus Sulfotelmatobacter sp.]
MVSLTQGRSHEDQTCDEKHQYVEHANTTKDYGGHGIGFSTGGGLTGSGMSGGADGADYETESIGDTPDADSAGPTGY